MFTEAIIAKIAFGIGSLSGAGLIVSQLPGVPEDLKSWPVTAMLTLLSLSCLALVGFMVRGIFKAQQTNADAQIETAKQQGAAVQVHSEMNTRLDELCQKIGDTNTESAKSRTVSEAMCEELKRRPCIMPPPGQPHA